MKKKLMQQPKYNIVKDYSRDNLLDEFGKQTIKDRYMISGEESPQDCFARAASAFASDQEHAQRLYDYASQLWFMFSTPILSNGGTERGLPISCFLNYVPDSLVGLSDHYVENIFLSSSGGGVAGYWGDVRPIGNGTSKGNFTTGVVPFMHVVDSEMLAFNQGATRRGSYAAYLDVSHPEIIEFLEMRKPSGGDINRKNLNIHHGINITNKFMEAVKNDEDFDLTYKGVKHGSVKARELWIKILETRAMTGEPYLHFIDHTNAQAPEYYKELGLKVHQSNLCTEITLHSNDLNTAVCCLSSLNAEKFDEWKNTMIVEDVTEMLDNVLQDFIESCSMYQRRAVNSVLNERAIGIGVMGFHSYLQRKNLPMNSLMAKAHNNNIFKTIRERAQERSEELGASRGIPRYLGICKVTRRNGHLLAVAPNASSSILCGNVSPSIEPIRANAFVQKTLTGSHLWKNKYLEQELEKVGLNTDEVWQSIITQKGSCQHVEGLSQDVKEVFLTAVEIDQMTLVNLAADRQKYIDQAQSLNLFFAPEADKNEVHHVHFKAWEKGLKTLYYYRSEALSRAETVNKKIEVKHREEHSDCVFCEG